MPRSITRRRFVYSSATIGALALLPNVTRNVLGANDKLRLAAIGAGGKGAVDIDLCSTEYVTALCDVDKRNAGAMFKRFDRAGHYTDFRQMLEKEEKNIDVVTVSTPDHLHAIAALTAMRMNKHVYCQKPLSHNVYEARLLTKVARDRKLITQMGNQGHAHPGTRRMVELVQAGAIGDVKEIHVWTDRPIWPQGKRAIAALKQGKGSKVPDHLDWNMWLGPAKERPYNPAYLPFKWRGFWDFGTGALGDMGCHNMDTPFFALELRDPVAVSAKSSELFDEAAPEWSTIVYEFPAQKVSFGTKKRPAVKLHWYDGRKKPDAGLAKQKQLPGNGVIMVGTKDTLYIPSYWGAGQFVSGRKVSDFDHVPITLPRTPQGGDNDRGHHQEWVAAVKANKPEMALSNFDYAGPMTEAVLLGNVAMRAQQRINWDAKAMKVTNVPEANASIRGCYRQGWELDKLV